MMTGMPPEMQTMMAQFPMPPEMMFGAMGMMPDPNAFAQPGGFPGGNFGQPPTGPSAQSSFGGFGAYPPPPPQTQAPLPPPPPPPAQSQQIPTQPQGYGGQQLQAPKFTSGQRMGSPNPYARPGLGVTDLVTYHLVRMR